MPLRLEVLPLFLVQLAADLSGVLLQLVARSVAASPPTFSQPATIRSVGPWQERDQDNPRCHEYGLAPAGERLATRTSVK